MDELKFELREADVHDAPSLLKISTETFFDTYASGNTIENMRHFLEENFTLSRILEELKDPHSKIYFAISEKEPVGYIKMNLHKEILDTSLHNGMEIARIYVRNDFKGKQIGTLLFNKAVSIANEHGLTYIWLGVWENNPAAIHFYEKMGFTKAGSHVFKLGNDLQRDIIMKYDL